MNPGLFRYFTTDMFAGKAPYIVVSDEHIVSTGFSLFRQSHLNFRTVRRLLAKQTLFIK